MKQDCIFKFLTFKSYMRNVLRVMINVALTNAIKYFLNQLNSISTCYILSFTVKPMENDC